MIQKYRYGHPFETEAVIMPVKDTLGTPDFLTVSNKDTLIFSYEMDKADIVYGLGEANRGINKRGFCYKSFCTDQTTHSEEKQSLYGAHNFLLIKGKRSFGLFVDYPGLVTFDIGYTRLNLLTIEVPDANLNLYIITGPSLLSITEQFRTLIGRSYIPPYFAFGFGQSRWGYQNATDVTAVANGYQSHDLPLDMIYLDIDYMDHYKDFTVNTERFPDFPHFTKTMKERGIRLIPIIDAGVKIEDGYSIYEEGKEHGYFCKKEDGDFFTAGVWPGRTHFPDVLNKEAREWFGSKYEFLISQGIDGFWNDMNEPAMFYSDEGIADLLQSVFSIDLASCHADDMLALRDKINSLSNRLNDYKLFYHNVNGTPVRHDTVHNLYGYNMTRAASEGFEKIAPNKRFLLFSRSSYIGMHRYGGIWTGDNSSWWSHLLLNIKMMPSLNMCGFLYSGADLGGFACDTTKDLLLRFLAFGIFTPLMRNHSAIGTRNQECYQFENCEDFKGILRLRYRLIPYLYSEFVKAALHNRMLFMPLGFLYEDDTTASHIEDQLLFADGLMLAPVYEPNAIGRHVYLPEDMLYLKFTSEDTYEAVPLKKGHHYIEVSLTEVPIFLRKNHFLLLANAADCTANLDNTTFTLIGEKASSGTLTLYRDNGFEKDYDNPSHYTTIQITNGVITTSDPSLHLTAELY
ncbi:MAG: alpha-glucosidase [Lachnospiraceae bacterium]|nr:alpha-glucosidase [Lachnospiraceae bacterium]